MEKFRGNEGFTLVELMIVLSIIAILAVVLVPKVGNMKDSVREQGVVANVSSVRALLEMEVNDRVVDRDTERDRLITAMQLEFSAGNEIVNPYTKGSGIAEWYTTTGTNRLNYSVGLLSVGGATSSYVTNANYTNQYTTREGQVMIFVCTDGYFIWGYGNDGKSIPYQVVK